MGQVQAAHHWQAGPGGSHAAEENVPRRRQQRRGGGTACAAAAVKPRAMLFRRHCCACWCYLVICMFVMLNNQQNFCEREVTFRPVLQHGRGAPAWGTLLFTEFSPVPASSSLASPCSSQSTTRQREFGSQSRGPEQSFLQPPGTARLAEHQPSTGKLKGGACRSRVRAAKAPAGHLAAVRR